MSFFIQPASEKKNSSAHVLAFTPDGFTIGLAEPTAWGLKFKRYKILQNEKCISNITVFSITIQLPD